MSATVIADTGPLVAVADRDDTHHEECVGFFDGYAGVVIVPAPVVVEVCWLLAGRVSPHAEAAFLAGLSGEDLRVVDLNPGDYQRAGNLVERYADLDLGFVDASVITLAERHRVDTIVTIDRRHFHVVRPSHVDVFTLLP